MIKGTAMSYQSLLKHHKGRLKSNLSDGLS